MSEEDTPRGVAPPRLLDQVRDELRRLSYCDLTRWSWIG
jgi:hypothetical protein